MTFSRLGASDEPLFRFSQYLKPKGRRRSTYEAERGGFVTHPPSRIPPERAGIGKEYVINPTLPRNPLHVGKPDVPDGK